jgi:hypothetical protein
MFLQADGLIVFDPSGRRKIAANNEEKILGFLLVQFRGAGSGCKEGTIWMD